MVKFNAKHLTIAVLFGILLIGVIGIVSAQEALPKGGDGFDTVVEIKPGSYEGAGLMEKGVKEYFYINVKPGQELKLEGTFKAFSDAWGEEELTLYNEDRKQLAKEGESLDKGEQVLFSFSWLPGSDKDLHKYYIKRECTWHKIESLSLNISLADRYDAGTQTDAGDTIEKATSVESGEYKAYLSGKEGTDINDFYKVAVKKGQTFVVKVTPPSEATMRITVYDKDRRVLKDEYSPNPGAIVTNALSITKSEDIFIGVICDRYCSDELVAYTLDITTEGVVVDEEEYDEEGLPYYGVDGAVSGDGVEEKEGSNWALILGIIALIVIIGIVAYFLLKKKKGKETTNDSQKL
jgi:hypothetical protein